MTDTAPQRQGDHGNGPLPVYLDYSLGVIGILAVGSWLLLQGKTELGTIVAFVSGLTRMNGPWGELVNYFRDLTNAGLKYRMIASELDLRAAEPA